MINRNVGTLERLIRLGLGLVLVFAVLQAPAFGVLQGVSLVAAFALFWNSIFGRCYLWKWLGITSCDDNNCADCPDSEQTGA